MTRLIVLLLVWTVMNSDATAQLTVQVSGTKARLRGLSPVDGQVA